MDPGGIVAELKIRYRGQLVGGNWVYSIPKVVELPIPFISKSGKIGEVICNPIGSFDYENGSKLLELSGKDGPFVLEDEPRPELAEIEHEPAQVIAQASALRLPVPRRERTEHEELLIQKRINRAQLMRGRRKRAVRSDKGVPRPRNKEISADTPVQAQAEIEQPSPQ